MSTRLAWLYGRKRTLQDELAGLKRLIADEEAFEASALKHAADKAREDVARRILNGETIVAVAASLGITPPAVQSKLQAVCRKANKSAYDAGVVGGSDNNYRTPPLQFLRDNKKAFGF